MADINATLEQQILNLPQRERISESWESGLRKGILKMLEPQVLTLEDAQFSHLPDELRSYLYRFDDYTIVSKDFVNSLILNNAQQLTGRIYAPAKLDDALKDIFKVGVTEAKLYGFQVDHLTLIRIAPLISILLTYLMYRRLRIIRGHPEDTTEPWVFLRIDNKLDEIISYALMLTPAIFVLAIFVLFCDTQGLGIVLFGRVISLRTLFTFSFPPTLSLFTQVDYYAVAVSILAALNLYWVVLSTWYIWEIIQYEKYVRRTYGWPR